MSRFRRSLVRLVRYFVTRPAALFGAGAVFLAAVAAAFLVPVIAPGQVSVPSLSLSMPRATLAGEPTATEAFLRGNRDYNADLVWTALSDEARGQMENRGASIDLIKQQMSSARERGYKIEDVAYVGNKELPDGTAMAFYVVGVRQQARADVEYVPYLFTLDPAGKIVKVQ